jgi:hypothetical protein
VVNGLRLMKSASGLFLGWTEGRHFCVRQLYDMKIKLLVEMFTQRDGPIRGVLRLGIGMGTRPGRPTDSDCRLSG